MENKFKQSAALQPNSLSIQCHHLSLWTAQNKVESLQAGSKRENIHIARYWFIIEASLIS